MKYTAITDNKFSYVLTSYTQGLTEKFIICFPQALLVAHQLFDRGFEAGDRHLNF